MKIKNKTLAIEAAPAAIPVKPNMAAIIAITMKITAHLSIIKNFSSRHEGKITCQKNLLGKNKNRNWKIV